MGLRFAVDFDETLVDRGPPPTWRPHARDVLRALAAAGHTLVLYSRRATLHGDPSPSARQEADDFWRTGKVQPDAEHQWAMFAGMRDFLRREGCWDLFAEVWQERGKPEVDYFLDDRVVDPSDWLTVWRDFGPRGG